MRHKPNTRVFACAPQDCRAITDHLGAPVLIFRGDPGIVSAQLPPNDHENSCYVIFDKHPGGLVWCRHTSLSCCAPFKGVVGEPIRLEIT